MGLDGKKWGQQDRISEVEFKDKIRQKNQRYYIKHSGKVKKNVKKNYRRKRAQIINELGGRCLFCGQSNPDLLNLHHNVPMTPPGSKIYHYIQNKDILCLLCIQCHVTWHNMLDWLKIDDIYKDN